MGRKREYGEDLTYAETHRNYLPEHYGRIGHRLDMANRDWTEFCHHCKIPLLIVEEVRDKGQDLLDKGVSVTRQLAYMANLPASLLAWRTERPKHVDDEINALNKRIRELEAAYPITGFTRRNLRQRNAKLTEMTTDQWFEYILMQHREHHYICASSTEKPVNVARLLDTKATNPASEPPDLLDMLKFDD
jgi:hypothetical protein